MSLPERGEMEARRAWHGRGWVDYSRDVPIHWYRAYRHWLISVSFSHFSISFALKFNIGIGSNFARRAWDGRGWVDYGRDVPIHRYRHRLILVSFSHFSIGFALKINIGPMYRHWLISVSFSHIGIGFASKINIGPMYRHWLISVSFSHIGIGFALKFNIGIGSTFGICTSQD